VTEHYQVLCTIASRHPYFADGLAQPLSLSPTPECLQLLRRYGLLFVAGPGGGTLLYRDAALLASYNEIAPLAFTLASSDTALLNYTLADVGIPDRWRGAGLADQVFYADNLRNPGDGAPALMPLFEDAALPLRGPRFLCRFAQAVGGQQLDLVDRLQQRSVWSMTAPAGAGESLPLDLRGLAPGRYQLQLNGAPQQEFYLSVDGPALGVVALYPGGPAQAPFMDGCRGVLEADGSLVPEAARLQPFQLRLQARSANLRYLIYAGTDPGRFDHWMVAARLKPQPAAASGNPKPITFACKAPVAGGDPWIYEADTPLPLRQVPEAWTFTLMPMPGAGPPSGNNVRLPYARGDVLLKSDPGPPAKLWSEVYVYL
jgi:hypothetical protein